MNTPHTWGDSPIHSQVRDAGLDPVNRTTNDTQSELAAWELLREARAENIGWQNKWQVAVEMAALAQNELITVTEQRDKWKAKYIQQNKDLGHELRDPNGTIWSECKRLQTELTAITEQLDSYKERYTKLAGKYAIEMHEITEQRDKLIKAIDPLKYWRDISECDCSCPLPQGGCLRCDLNRILEIANSQDQARP